MLECMYDADDKDSEHVESGQVLIIHKQTLVSIECKNSQKIPCIFI